MKVVFLLFSLFMVTVEASDFAKEKRWAEQTVDSIMDGDAVWLEADDREFLSIYTEAEESSSRAMIVVHGTGIHPNWEQVVQPLRVEMTQFGWNTLSIQMPVLPNEASYKDYLPLYPEVLPRIKAAEKYLLEQGNKKLVIVAHSQGAAMSSYYLANSNHAISAFVAIGMPSRQTGGSYDSTQALKKITIPVLDLFGSEDLPTVLNTTTQRAAASRHNSGYEQQKIPGAGHFFDGHEEALINAVNDWISRN